MTRTMLPLPKCQREIGGSWARVKGRRGEKKVGEREGNEMVLVDEDDASVVHAKEEQVVHGQ